MRAFRGELPSPPDLVAYPRDEAELTAVLDWCGAADIAVIPYGGGSSVVGGVETAIPGARRCVSLDLGRLDRVLEIDRVSRAARIQAGVLGPALEDQLRPHGLTLRHFPQSFEFSTLGGWIATRSGGHYATLYTHIDDFVESLRVVTPSGVVETRRLPASGAGPSPDRLFIGSEGILGVITEAWMRLQDRPSWRAGASVRFDGPDGFLRGAEAVRRLAQSGLHPANCRLLDPQRGATSGAGDGSHAVLVLGFESADHPSTPGSRGRSSCAATRGGAVPEPQPPRRAPQRRARRATARPAPGGERSSQAPYLRDVLVALLA